MGSGIVNTIAGSGRISPNQLQGNPGRYIVQLKRVRADNKFDPNVITESLWQIVQAVSGTWLTAVAKYGDHLKWSNNFLYRVYSNEYVQACEPGTDDTKPEYNFFDFQEGGAWEDGIYKPPKVYGPRDRQVEKNSYWAFKIKEIVVYQKPQMDDDELLRRRKKMIDYSFEKALVLNQKKELLDKLKELEQTVFKIENSKMNEEIKLKEFEKLLEQLKEKVTKNVVDHDAVEFIESWFHYALKSLKQSVNLKEKMSDRVKKEIDYLKFRCAEYDLIHEYKQKIEKVQKGTEEEDQWKKMPPIISKQSIELPENKNEFPVTEHNHNLHSDTFLNV